MHHSAHPNSLVISLSSLMLQGHLTLQVLSMEESGLVGVMDCLLCPVVLCSALWQVHGWDSTRVSWERGIPCGGRE